VGTPIQGSNQRDRVNHRTSTPRGASQSYIAFLLILIGTASSAEDRAKIFLDAYDYSILG
jgi:hypothetical protein